MPTVGTTSKPAYIYDAGTDTWVPVGVGAHTHDTSALVSVNNHFAAGKNKIINGDFGIWQRGTSTTFTANTSGGFVSDRWQFLCDDGSGGSGSKTISQQSFTPGNTIAGYEAPFFIRVNSTVASSAETYSFLTQLIEDVRTFAGQAVTFSFWAKAASNTTLPSFSIRQSFGSGGSAVVDTTITTNIALTTSWQRFSYTFTVPSISGKTIGAGSFLRVGIFHPLRTTYTTDFWGVQLESGSTVTPFSTASGSIGGELALCQRYYFRFANAAVDKTYFLSRNFSNIAARGIVFFPVTMRTAPTFGSSAANTFSVWTNTDYAANGIAGFDMNTTAANIQVSVASGLTANDATAVLSSSTSTTSYLEFSSEL